MSDGWECEAYGADLARVGAVCFFGAHNRRTCTSAGDCSDKLVVERQRVWQKINELAAAGDPDFAALARELASPDQLLGGKGEARHAS